MALLRLALLLTAVAVSAAEEEHEAHAWEWAGAVKLEASETYIWTAAKNANLKYADPFWQLYFTPSTTSDSEGIESAEAAAEAGFNTTATLAPAGHTLTPGTLWNLTMDQESFMTQWKIAPAATSPYIIFSQHDPSEFEGFGMHWLKSDHGEDVEADATEPAAAAKPDATELATVKKHDLLGEALGASFLTALCSFIGVVLFAKNIAHWVSESYAAVFASGTLLAISCTLIFPEAVRNMGSMKEAEANALFGISAILGFMVHIVNEWITSFCFGPKISEAEPTTVVAKKDLEAELGDAVAVKTDATSSASKPSDGRLPPVARSVLFGDALHNFADGISIGAAFAGCGSSLGWTVAVGSIAHELSQELSDFLLLTKTAGIGNGKALALNFLSGLTCVVGTLVVEATDPSANAIGAMLAFSGGTYFYLATIPVWPKLLAETTDASSILKHCLTFLLGVIAIGLVLLEHTHCDGGGMVGTVAEGGVSAPAEPHAGHGH